MKMDTIEIYTALEASDNLMQNKNNFHFNTEVFKDDEITSHIRHNCKPMVSELVR